MAHSIKPVNVKNVREFTYSVNHCCNCRNWIRFLHQRDITTRGSFLLMGLCGLIIAMVINMFVGSSATVTVISVIGIIIFTVLTAYDAAKIKSLAEDSDMNNDEAAGKVAVTGALELYLDFINLFLYLLFLYLIRLFWKKND